MPCSGAEQGVQRRLSWLFEGVAVVLLACLHSVCGESCSNFKVFVANARSLRVEVVLQTRFCGFFSKNLVFKCFAFRALRPTFPARNLDEYFSEIYPFPRPLSPLCGQLDRHFSISCFTGRVVFISSHKFGAVRRTLHRPTYECTQTTLPRRFVLIS